MRLSEAAVGSKVRIKNVFFPPAIQNRMLGLGFVPGSAVEVVREAPLGDPRVYRIRGKLITLRNNEAWYIEVEPMGSEIPLSMAEVGRRYEIVGFSSGRFFLSRVSSLGLKPGTVVEVLDRYPMVLRLADGRAVNVGMGMAEKITVREVV